MIILWMIIKGCEMMRLALVSSKHEIFYDYPVDDYKRLRDDAAGFS